MNTIAVIEKLVTKPRPQSVAPPTPIQETRSTHSGTCPICGAEIQVKTGDQADVFGSCVHFRGVIQINGRIEISFEDAE